MKILLVDDHVLFRAGLRLLLATIAPAAELFEASSVREAVGLLSQQADIVLCLLDLALKDSEGLEALHRIKLALPAMGVVVVSAAEDAATVRACLDRGAMGFIPKSATPDALTLAVRTVLAGGIHLPNELLRAAPSLAPSAPTLTPRQLDVLAGLSRGLPTKLIARELGLSDYTVKEHIALLFQALGVHNRTEAVIQAAALGLAAPLGVRRP